MIGAAIISLFLSADPARPALADAPPYERQAIQKLLTSPSWATRAVGTVRLERFGDQDSEGVLASLLGDPSWQVRTFAMRSLGRRRAPARPGWLEAEDNPRVVRAAMRHGYDYDAARLERGVRYLSKQPDLEDKMLAVELAALSGDAVLVDLGRETLRTVILRMERAEAGSLSPRLAAVTGAEDVRRPNLWQNWLRKAGRDFALRPARGVSEGSEPVPLSALAALEPQQFANLRDYMDGLQGRSVDLAICLDTTASMSGELAAAQGGIDDLMLFASEVVADFRVGIVAYRDRRNRYETKWWDFTPDIPLARQRLWSLDASEGGDTPESVHAALRQAYGGLSWVPEHTKVLVLVGDAPPHVGFGQKCVTFARVAFDEARVVTHVIQSEGKEIEHFPQIAEAGHGRCVSLEDDDELVAEISGLTLGERFSAELREFFRVYLELCR